MYKRQLRRPGEAAAASGLGASRLRARLGPPAAAAELDVVLLRAHEPVALRDDACRRHSLSDGPAGPVGRRHHRLQHPCHAHGLAAGLSDPDAELAVGRGPSGCCRARTEGLRGERLEVRRPGLCVGRSRQRAELPPQYVRVALEPARLLRQGPRVFPEAPARHLARRARQGSRPGRPREAERGQVARGGAARKARPARDARLPHVDHVRLFRHRAADGHLVREERPQYLRHASLHPSAVDGGGPGVGGAFGLGDL